MISTDVPDIIVSLTRILQKWLLKMTDIVIVANKRIASLIGAENAIVIMNCPSEAELPSPKIEDHEAQKAGARNLGYFGSLEPGRFLTDAMELISGQQIWSLVVAGDGTLITVVEEAAKNYTSIAYLGKLPQNEAMKKAAGCNVMLVMFDPLNINNVIGSPNRLFEAMSVGVPPIVTTNTYSAEIVLSEKCGFVCDYDKRALSELIDKLNRDPSEIFEYGKRAREAFKREYNWKKQELRLIQIYTEIDDQSKQ